MEMYEKNPINIETKSMEIIESEMSDASTFSRYELPVIKRVIHTTADFEYEKLIEFSPDAVIKGIEALKKGKKIYADTKMIQSGVNKKLLNKFNSEVINLVHDKDVEAIAKKTGVTRSMAAIDKVVELADVSIFAIGNAPTALFKIIELTNKEIIKPDLIIGVPVGFVGAAESKEALSGLNIPYIRVNGRKGGSPVAVSMINAMLLQG